MTSFHKLHRLSGVRLIGAAAAGAIATIILSLTKVGAVSLLLGWDAAALTFVIWTWIIVWPMDHHQTTKFALREDPSRTMSDVILNLASVASLAGVGEALFLAHGSVSSRYSLFLTLAGIFSVIASWILIHTIYSLRYARLYYSKEIEGSVDFKGDRHPTYSDFAYLAFTLGMTFQVADTDLIGSGLRKTVLRHALLSYVFGTVIVATTVSLISGLGR